MSAEPNTVRNPNMQAPRSVGASRYIFIGAIVLLGAAVWLVVLPRLAQDRILKADSQQVSHQAPRVDVVWPHMEIGSDLTLPGNVQAVSEVTIFARASGYISRRYFDIGERVHAGQILADIESPEAKLQLEQAQADTSKSRNTVLQSQADVEKQRAGVAQAQADSSRAAASTEQSRAMVSNALARLAQAKASRSESEAKLAESKHALDGQKSAVEQSEAQMELATTTARRYRELLQEGFVTQQDDDQAQATLKVARAASSSAKSAVGAATANVQAAQEAINSAEAAVDAATADVSSSRQSLNASIASERSSHANVAAIEAGLRSSQSVVQVNRSGVNSQLANERRFGALSGFQRVRAPFDGVITARNVDVGTLVTAGGAATNLGPTTTVSTSGLFGLARTDELRIQVSVPQAYFQSIATGTKATVSVQEMPGRVFEGAVTMQSGALDSSSRTRMTEIRLKNPKGVLLPGMFARVVFAMGGKRRVLRVPANALDVGKDGTRVAVVRPDSTLHFVKVLLGRDFGPEAEVLEGLTGDERMVSNPTSDLKDGMRVEVASGGDAGPKMSPAGDHTPPSTKQPGIR